MSYQAGRDVGRHPPSYIFEHGHGWIEDGDIGSVTMPSRIS
jgi:hypothetical protein